MVKREVDRKAIVKLYSGGILCCFGFGRVLELRSDEVTIR